jgi:predicted PurR-regulated permease PerM
MTLSDRERSALRWTLLPLPIITIGIALFLLANIVNAFSSVMVMFFLAWLLAFLIDPVVSRIVTRHPFLPRGVAAGLVFAATVVLAIALLAAIGSSVVTSLRDIIGTAPTIDDAIGKLLAPIQTQLDTLGFQINLTRAASDVVQQFSTNASALLAFALNSGLQLFSVGSAIIFIAVVFVANKGQFLAFALRLVPADQRALSDQFVEATGRSFGGFVRGQFGLAALYGLMTGFIALVYGVPFAALIFVVTTVLQSVPYFGQLVCWIPLLTVTLVFQPQEFVPVTITFVVLLLIVQNFVTPRVMGNAVGLNPVLVLGAVFVGAQLAGAFGAIFGVPVLAVIASLFDTWLDKVRPESEVVAPRGEGSVVEPAAERRPGDG